MGHVTIVHPAPLFESRALLDPLVRHKALLGLTATYQLAAFDTFGLVHDGRLLAVIGFSPEATADEVFLAGLPSAAVTPHMVQLARACRLILAARLHSYPRRSLVARVARDNEVGGRLARLAGFSSSPSVAPGPCEEWTRGRLGQESLRRSGGRRGQGVGGAGDRAAASLDDFAAAPATSGGR